MSKIRYLLLLLLPMALYTHAQRPGDTTATINEFNQVMSFAVQPYLHYSSVISMHTGPWMDTTKGDDMLHNEFYKLGDDLYYGNDQEEIYLQDSLMVRINHSRKTIQLNKVDMTTRKKIDILPLNKMDMQKMLREHCSISRLADEGDTGNIILRLPEKQAPQGATSSEMTVKYRVRSHLPLLMELSFHVRQQRTDQMVEMLKAQGFDVGKMEQEVNGKKSLAMTQTASVSFEGIETTKEKAQQMPLWSAQIGYDDHANNFIGKGRCEGYEVIKTF